MEKLNSLHDHDLITKKINSRVLSLRFLMILAFFIVALFSIICISFPTISIVNPSLYNVFHVIISNSPPKIDYYDTCLSRGQQYFLRDGETLVHEVPPLLAQAWKNYGELRAQCDVVDELNNEKLNRSFKDVKCRYLLFSDSQLCGLGNRIAALASAITYAMATDRVLLLDNRRKLGDLLCEPFPHHTSSWLLPSTSPYHSLIDRAQSLAAYISRRKPTDDDDLRKDASEEEGSIVKVSLWDEPTDGDLEIFDEEVYNRLTGVKWVVWESDLYTIPNLFLVPTFWRCMHSLFAGNEDEIFALISRLALCPANDVWAMVLKEYAGYMASASVRVGVQIRLHGRSDPAVFDENAMSMVMACLINNSYLPVVVPAGSLNTTSATTLAMMYGQRIWAGKDNVTRGKQRHSAEADVVAVLVASLQSQYFLRMKDLYSTGVGMEDGKVVRMHSVSSLRKQDFSFRQAQLALAEMWLLSGSHRLAISASSTFGYAAQAWGGLRPIILDFSGQLDVHCKRGYSSDPCSHLPRPHPGFNLTSLAHPHAQWILRHLRVCQDRPTAAWQLVPSHIHPNKAPPVFSEQGLI